MKERKSLRCLYSNPDPNLMDGKKDSCHLLYLIIPGTNFSRKLRPGCFMCNIAGIFSAATQSPPNPRKESKQTSVILLDL